MEKQDVGAGSDHRTAMKVMQPSQGRNFCGSCSYRAQHVTWHEGVNAVCLRELILGFPYFCVLDLQPLPFIRHSGCKVPVSCTLAGCAQ